MKWRGIQNSQLPNLLENWENFGSATYAYIQNPPIFHIFMNWEKMRSLTKATLKSIKISLWIGENLDGQPKTKTQNPNFEKIKKLMF